jgi:hypothetical protein
MLRASRHVSLVRLGVFSTAWALAVLVSFLLFSGLIGSSEGQTELACAKKKLEAMWHVKLSADAELVASKPGSGVVTADWDLKVLGCSGAVYPDGCTQAARLASAGALRATAVKDQL